MVAPLFRRKGFPQHKFPTAQVTPDQPIPQSAQWGWMARPAVVNTSVVFVGAAALFTVVASVPSHFVYAAPVQVKVDDPQVFGSDQPLLFGIPPALKQTFVLDGPAKVTQPSSIWGTTPRTIVPLGPAFVLQPGSPFLPESWVQEQLQVPVSTVPGSAIFVQPQDQATQPSWITSSMQLPGIDGPPVSPSWTHAWTYIGQLPELQPSNIWGTPLIDSVVPVPDVIPPIGDGGRSPHRGFDLKAWKKKQKPLRDLEDDIEALYKEITSPPLARQAEKVVKPFVPVKLRDDIKPSNIEWDKVVQSIRAIEKLHALYEQEIRDDDDDIEEFITLL